MVRICFIFHSICSDVVLALFVYDSYGMNRGGDIPYPYGRSSSFFDIKRCTVLDLINTQPTSLLAGMTFIELDSSDGIENDFILVVITCSIQYFPNEISY